MLQSRKINIVLLTYNRSHFLKKCIDSVLSQTYIDFNFVIINNGSTDSTEEIIDSYKDLRITNVKVEKNSKETISKAFEYTNSEYLAIIHDDDMLHKDFILKQTLKLDQNTRINALACSIKLINEKGEELNKIRPRIISDKYWEKNEFIEKFFIRGNIMTCPTVIYRSSIVHKYNLKFNFDVGPAADLYLFFQLNLLNGIIGITSDPLYYYRIHQNQDSEINRLELEYTVRPYIIELLKLNNNDLTKKYKKSSLGIILSIILNEYLSNNLSKKQFKICINKLIAHKITLNYYTVHWFFIGFIRGVKNKFL